jgi:hypothetical protein
MNWNGRPAVYSVLQFWNQLSAEALAEADAGLASAAHVADCPREPQRVEGASFTCATPARPVRWRITISPAGCDLLGPAKTAIGCPFRSSIRSRVRTPPYRALLAASKSYAGRCTP